MRPPSLAASAAACAARTTRSPSSTCSPQCAPSAVGRYPPSGLRLCCVIAWISRTRPFPELTERETEVLDLIAAGRNDSQIATQLYLLPKTIRNNVTSILAKLQATDRAEVIIRARDAGLGTDRR
jgi:DNA-binding NarL/FixJ family response regulator